MQCLLDISAQLLTGICNHTANFQSKQQLCQKWPEATTNREYQENCSPENCPYENTPMNIPPMKAPPVKITPQKFGPDKIAPCDIPSPLINHANQRKNKSTHFFALTKAVQYNILIKITKVLFDTQKISQKILGLDTFFTQWNESKNQMKAKIKSRRTKTRQSNYKMWQICETTK